MPVRISTADGFRYLPDKADLAYVCILLLQAILCMGLTAQQQ